MDREGVKGRENAPLTLALSRERLCHNQLSSLRATEGRAAISILSGTSEIASVASLLLMNNFEGHCGEPKPRAKRGGKRSNLNHFSGLLRRAHALLLMNNFEGHCERSEAISVILVDCRVGLTASSQ